MNNDNNAKSKKSVLILIPVAALTICLAIGLIAYMMLTKSDKGTSAPAQEKVESTEKTEVEQSDKTEESDSSDIQVDTAEVQENNEDAAAESNNDEPQEDAAENEESAARIIPSLKPDRFYYYNGHTYGLYDAKDHDLYSYYKCADFCRQQGGHLAVMNDDDENGFLFDIVREDYKITVFFGYSDEEEEGAWKWSDGQSGYENWTSGDDWNLPDNGVEYGGDEDYAEFNYDAEKDWIPNDGTWNDAPFMDNTSLFICEWDYEVN